MISFQSSQIKPLESMQVAFDKALKKLNLSFSYPDPSGDINLRKLLKQYHSHWEGNCLITNSATEATYLALSLLEGKTLALNVPSYFGVIRQAKHFNIKILEWETTEDLLALDNYDGILLTSNFTPPTGKSFSDNEKSIIAQCANKNNALVIEDNAYEFLSYENDKKLTSINADSIIHINSFSKILSPSLRLGFLMAKEDIFKKLRSTKITMNLSSSPISQSIIYEVLNNSDIIEDWRSELQNRATILSKLFKDMGIDIEINEGGSFVKLNLNENIDIKDFIQVSKENGLILDDNKNQYSDNNSKNYIRLHIGAVDHNDILNSIELFKKTFSYFNL